MALTRCLALLAALLAMAPAAALASAPEIVVVAGNRSPVKHLTVREVRRLYLGLPSPANGPALKPLRNLADPAVNEAFLQRVMFMTAQDYERQIQLRLGRNGGSRPLSYEELSDILAALQRDPLAVTYLTRSQAMGTRGIRILGEP